MTRIALLLALTLPVLACNGNENHPVGAPSGIISSNGGGVRQLDRVPGVDATARDAGVISKTRVQ